MSILLSNKKQFWAYLIIRSTSFLLGLLVIMMLPLGYEETSFYQFLQILAPALILPILLFEYLHTPTFLSVYQNKTGLKLSFYKPDHRYFFFLRKKYIQELFIKKQETVLLKIESKLGGMVNMGIFLIQRDNGMVTKTTDLNLDFFRPKEIEQLEKMVETHNYFI